MAELKPCPFCGMPASVWKHKYPSGDTFYEPLILHESGCMLDHVIWCGDYETEDDLAAAWNRREGEDGT